MKDLEVKKKASKEFLSRKKEPLNLCKIDKMSDLSNIS